MVPVFDYFCHAHGLRLQPTLLEFSHPTTGRPLSVCGVEPSTTLVVQQGQLFVDGVPAGSPLDIFDHLEKVLSNSGFFPAYLGYFSYEFARHFNGPVKDAVSAFPEAFFRLYHRGVVMSDGRVVEGELPACPAPRLAKPVVQQIRPLMSREAFYERCQAIKQKIRAGDVYQVNLSLPFGFAALDHEMLGLYQAMRQANKSPFMGIVHHDDKWILSGSPERLFHWQGDRISVRPIAGTKRRHHEPGVENELVAELTQCPKENAEHAMLVDLLRNDLNQVAQPGSTVVSEDRSVEFYSHVMHLVSQVQATTQASLKDIFAAIFPGGTITGAPKMSVMSTIAELEIAPRGPYTGALGYVSGGFGCDFNILIRSVFKSGKDTIINAGAGIVIDSDDDNEWQEVNKKTSSLNDILSDQVGLEKSPPRPNLRGPAVASAGRISSRTRSVQKVLFLENHDSFSFNIVDSLRSLGADVFVYDKLEKITGEENFTHALIGPGPGSPVTMPHLAETIELAMRNQWPILGICLGHQAIGHFFGAAITRLPRPVHGQVHAIAHTAQGLFAGLPSPLSFTRYHSLAIRMAPADFLVDAVSADDCIMAIRHKTIPIFGLQFHPESYLSKAGHELLRRFLHG